MDDDRVGRLVGRLRALEAAALQAFLGVDGGVLVGDFGDAEPLDADAEAGRIHHREHVPHALVRQPDQPARCLLEIDHRGRRRLDPHLVLDRAAGHPVAGPGNGLAVLFLGQEFGHQEQRNAPDALRRIGQTGEHQMENVLGQIVLAGGDEYLGAGDPVGPVATNLVIGLGLGADETQIGAALGLGQAHRPGPAPVDQLG